MIDPLGDLSEQVFRAIPRHRRLAIDPEIVAGFIKPDPFYGAIWPGKPTIEVFAVIGEVGYSEKYLFVGSQEFIRAAMLACINYPCSIPSLMYAYQFQRRREREHPPVSDPRNYPEILKLEALIDRRLNGARAMAFDITHSVLPARPSAEAVRQAVTRQVNGRNKDEDMEVHADAVVEFLADAMAAVVLHQGRVVDAPAAKYSIIPAAHPVDVGRVIRDINRSEEHHDQLRRSAHDD